MMRLLIIDDSSVMRKLIRRALRQADFTDLMVEEAEDGKDGLEKMRTSQPDLVMCDWNMPELSGLDVLRTMREAGSQTPFVFVTSENTAEMLALATGAGALGLISKPFTPESIESVLRQVVS